MFFVDEKDVDFDVNTAENANNGDATKNGFSCYHLNVFEHHNDATKLSFLK